jgi:hypothetical protein
MITEEILQIINILYKIKNEAKVCGEDLLYIEQNEPILFEYMELNNIYEDIDSDTLQKLNLILTPFE